MTGLGERGPVVVVGAGPAGSLLSILLADRGHDVHLFESRPDLRRVDIGAGRSINLALATRGLVALRRVGVIDAVDEITIPMRGRMIHDRAGGETLQPYGLSDHDVIHSVGRSALNAILLDRAESTGRVTIEFSQRCRSVDLDRRSAMFTDESGTVRDVPFGVIFGTDGSASVVRDAITAANGGSVVEEPLGHGYKELVLPAGEGGVPQLDPHALHIWPRGGFMLIALANPGGDFTVTLFLPSDGPGASFASLGSADEIEAFFEREFADFAALVPDVAADFSDGPTGALATIRCQGWSHRDRALVLGDASHAIVPFHGQGMNAAMESCLVLDRHLDAGGADLAATFAGFESERRADTDAIADMALDNYVEMRSSVAEPAYVLRREVALELERRHPDRFGARYGMVMFTTVPYAEVRSRAAAQSDLLGLLTHDVDHIDDIDWARADTLVMSLNPLPHNEATGP